MKEARIFTEGERQSSDYAPEPDPIVAKHITLGERIGQGKRSQVWRVQIHGKEAALKVYRQSHIRKYAKRYGLNIAQFEYDRNRLFRDTAGLENYCAEPLAVFDGQDGLSPAFAQSLVDGPRLIDKATELGYCPPEVLAAGYRIVELAAAVGLHDLDINSGNIRLHQHDNGWQPILHDFNMVPQHIHAPNPLRAMMIKLGIRDRSIRDYQTLERWKQLGPPLAKRADVN